MSVALKGVPVAPLVPPPTGLVRGGDDWLYEEWLGGDWIARIGADGTVTRASAAAPAAPPEPAASGTTIGQ